MFIQTYDLYNHQGKYLKQCFARTLKINFQFFLKIEKIEKILSTFKKKKNC